MKDTAAYLPRFNHSFVMACLEVWNTYNKERKISVDEINAAPEKVLDILHMVDREVFNMLKYHISYFGNLRAYEGEWIRRSDGVKIVKRFYDEREWRSLKTLKDQTNLTFNAADISILLVDTNAEKEETMRIAESLKEKLKIESLNAFSEKIFLFSEVIGNA